MSLNMLKYQLPHDTSDGTVVMYHCIPFHVQTMMYHCITQQVQTRDVELDYRARSDY